MEYIYCACSSPHWHAAQASRDPKALRRAAAGLSRDLVYHIGSSPYWTYEQIQDAIAEWLDAWLLFHVTIPHNWCF